jgi:cAMP phosphodiesterase
MRISGQDGAMAKESGGQKKQLLHLVFGGELTSIEGVEFRDLSKLDIVGIFPDYESARRAWKAKAQQTVDQAQTRYFIVHMHRLLDPDTDVR